MTRAVRVGGRVAAVALAAALEVSWVGQPVPLVLKIVPVTLLAISVVRPSAGLLALAALGPLCEPVSIHLRSPFAGDRFLEQLVLAVITAVAVTRWKQEPGARLAAPALLVGAVAVASAIAVQPALVLRFLPGTPIVDALRAMVAGSYFTRSTLSEPIYYAALTVEGVALASIVERLVRQDPALGRSLVRMLVVGAAGLALLTSLRLVEAGLRSGEFVPSLTRLVSIRYSYLPDLNAAGSVYLMVLMAGIGLLGEARRLQDRAWMLAALGAITLGLWIAGSRSALAALVLVAMVLVGLAALRRRGAARWLVLGALAAGLAAAGVLASAYPAGRNATVSAAVSTRAILFRTAARMWLAAPTLGQGIGRFYDVSADFGAAALAPQSAEPVRQNAHNNFLQVLAEEGLLGLGATLLWLAAALGPAWRTERVAPDPLRRYVLAGIVGYLLTWLSGHPQLVADAAFMFFLLFGALAAMTPPAPPSTWRTALVIASVLVLATAPFRALLEIRRTDFANVGIGLSGWRSALDDVRYREAGATFSLYIPCDGTVTILPVRRASNAPDPLVLVSGVGEGRQETTRVSGDAWTRLTLPPDRDGRAYRLVRFAVANADSSASGPVILVGKLERR